MLSISDPLYALNTAEKLIKGEYMPWRAKNQYAATLRGKTPPEGREYEINFAKIYKSI